MQRAYLLLHETVPNNLMQVNTESARPSNHPAFASPRARTHAPPSPNTHTSPVVADGSGDVLRQSLDAAPAHCTLHPPTSATDRWYRLAKAFAASRAFSERILGRQSSLTRWATSARWRARWPRTMSDVSSASAWTRLRLSGGALEAGAAGLKALKLRSTPRRAAACPSDMYLLSIRC